MRLLVLDADVLCSAILLPHGPARKLLVLAAYGGVSQYLDTVAKPELELLEEAAKGGGRVGGNAAARLEKLSRRRAALKGALPPGAPDDICLVGHRPIFDEAMKCVRQKGEDNIALWTGLETAAHHRLVDACFHMVSPQAPVSQIQRLQRFSTSVAGILIGAGSVDPGHPPVYAASETDALLLTRSPLLPRFQAAVNARDFDEFLSSPPWPADFNLDHVDGRLFDDEDVWG